MIIESPQPTKTVIDYEIIFEGGLVNTFTIDTSRGDTVIEDDREIKIYGAPKPSLSDPSILLPSDHFRFFVSKICSIHTRERVVVAMTRVQEEDWQKTLKELVTSDTIH